MGAATLFRESLIATPKKLEVTLDATGQWEAARLDRCRPDKPCTPRINLPMVSVKASQQLWSEDTD